jgi:DNA segregation ATPase FtsK/SpoIIIE, S-DNA-T family
VTFRSAAPVSPAPARGAALADLGADVPLELPPAWSPPARAGIPLLASVVPVLGAVALWAVTGSILSLWLAALGPLIAMATLADGARGVRRDRRRAERAAALARERVARAVGERHTSERERRWAHHPDVAGFLVRDSEIWRPVPDRLDALVAGSGAQDSGLRVTGGGQDSESVKLRATAAALEAAPALVPPSAGFAVVADDVLGAAVVRALTLQLCLALPPGELAVVGPLRGENEWAERLPHRIGDRPGERGTGRPRTLALIAPGEPVPDRVDIPIVRVEPGTPPPRRCRAVLTVHSPLLANLDFNGVVRDLVVEAVGADQAIAIADDLVDRAGRTSGAPQADGPVALSTILEANMPARGPAVRAGTLAAVIGLEAGEPRTVDLVADGPHAIVAGVTGAGKSELLITWVVSLCATYSTREVSFLLADFKGGTAFDSLGALHHVTGVLTDLDGTGARRAIESLRAEIRWREAELARSGARDILDPRVELPRLVVIVDEFAALLGDHPELHAVFADVAARGRALGMHLVLGTQRPSGVMRESLLANCPLRISLRVGDPADSRVVIGTGEATDLPGGTEGRGLALIRTGADSAPRIVRIALSSAEDIGRVASESSGPPPRRPWLPELPAQVSLEDLQRIRTASIQDGELLLGLADEPEHQRQLPATVHMRDRGLLVIGTAGSGRTTVLRTLATQAVDVEVVPSDGEGGWDAVADLRENPPRPGSVILLDDLDALISCLPHDYAHEITERLEGVIRSAGAAGYLIIASAQRLGGAASRLADLLPRRLVLPAASRMEYIASGGDAAHYAPGDPPGRARLDGRAVQIATASASPALLAGVSPSGDLPTWTPAAPLSGFVARRSPTTRGAIAAWQAVGARVRSVEEFVTEAEFAGDGPIVVCGDPDEWQRHWRALSTMRSECDLLVDASCAPEVRMLTGERALPPYCESGRARAWLIEAGAAPVRVVLPRGRA